MKVSELLEATIQTRSGIIVRAASHEHIQKHLNKSVHNELRAIVLPNELWFMDAMHLIHDDMWTMLRLNDSDLSVAAGVFIRPGYPDLLNITRADWQYKNFYKMKSYPIVKRLSLNV